MKYMGCGVECSEKSFFAGLFCPGGYPLLPERVIIHKSTVLININKRICLEHMPHLILLSFLPPTLSIVVLVLGGAVAFLLTYLLTFGVITLTRKMGWVEKPVAGKIHTVPLPRVGG